MRRDSFLKLTGLSVDNHKNLKRRNLLPYDEEVFGEPQGWTEYRLEQAISTVLALDLAKVGVDQEIAANLVDRNDSEILQAVKLALKNDAENEPDIWLAVVRFDYRDGELLVERREVVVAALEELYRAQTTSGRTVSELERHGAAIAMTNLSRAVRVLKWRADQNEIEVDFNSIYVPEWFMPDGSKA
jgi:hypothetical protein